MERFICERYAHRGLHGDGAAENSLTAFRLAVEGGYGIELDIRLSRDGELVVFHDETLERVCGDPRRVVDLELSELRSMRLSGTEDTVPTLREVLELVAGRVPLLIEIKLAPGESGVAEKFIEEIRDYGGEYIVESFNPMALRYVRRSRSDILIGILSAPYTRNKKLKGKAVYRQLEKLRLNFLFRPDFIAYDKDGHDVTALRVLRGLHRVPTVAWTVRSEDEERAARAHGFDTVIFEGYTPNDERK